MRATERGRKVLTAAWVSAFILAIEAALFYALGIGQDWWGWWPW